MKDTKKLIRLLSGLACLVFCAAFLLTGCLGNSDKPTEPEGSTVETTTEPDNTLTEETTEPDVEQTTETTEEPTEETTEAATEATNTGGTGGGYTPQVTEPAEETTEPEATEPEIQVPAPGSQENPYYEDITAPGSFTTVKIPAKGSIGYVVKTSAAYLQIQSAEAAIIYDGKTYEPVDGVVTLALPESKEPVRTKVQFVNNGTAEQAFSVALVEAEGASSNPIVLTDISALQTKLEKDDADGLYYTWTADQSGILTLGLSSIQPAGAGADIVVTVNGNTVKLSQSDKGILQIPVTAQDQVTVQVVALADADGSYPAVEVQVNGYIAPMKSLTVAAVPQTLTTDEIPAGENIYYSISGVKDTILTIQDPDITVYYNGTAYGADENGTVTVKLTQDTVQLELVNGSSAAKVCSLSFRYPMGHKENPEVLNELGELRTLVEAGTDGYYYSYTVPSNGAVTFLVQVKPEQANVWTNIVLTNTQTQVTESLMTETVMRDAVSVEAAAGDEILICVSVTAGDSVCVDAKLTVKGELTSYRLIEYPGFQAEVPANDSCWYEGYNLDGTIFTLTGENVAVTHNGVTYIPQDGKLQFMVESENRMPAQFVIENRSNTDAVYTVTLEYPVGDRMNPAAMALGSSYIVLPEGADDYCFAYTAPKDGQIVLTFDENAQWRYAVDNLTQQTYGDDQYSDSEDSSNVTALDVQAGDEILLRVNTYNSEEPWNAPGGRVDFTATLITGPVEITDLSKPVEAVLLSGETVEFTGKLQGVQLTIENAQYATLCCNGEYYEADENGVLTVSFLEPYGTAGDFSFTLQNRSTADWNCTMVFTNISGGPLAPGQLLLGVSSVNNAQGASGYWFSYTAPKDGELVLSFDEEKAWTYAVNGAEQCFSTDAEACETVIAVKQDDQVLVWVNTYDPADPETAPAGEVSFEATLITGPVAVTDLDSTFETVLLAGETVRYTGVLHGTTLTIADAKDATLYYNGDTYEAGEDGILSVTFLEPNGMGELEFTLHNRAMSDWNCTMEIAAVSGGPQAPGELTLGSSDVESGEGASGYWFSYTAPKDGELVLIFPAEENWCYAINGGDVCCSDAEPAVNERAVAVKTGDQVLIWVNTYDPEAPETAPAGKVSFEAKLITSPVELDLTQNYTAQLLAQETAQYTGELRNAIITFLNAENLTVTYNGDVYEAEEGIIRVTFLEPDSDGQWKFALTNSGSKDVESTMQFSGIVGSWLNPDDMVLGKNTAQQEADAAQYCFAYTAPKAGTLVLTFDDAANWRYSIGDETWYSGSEPAANEAQIPVEAGDEVVVRVNTYDPDDPDAVPAGTVEFSAMLITGPALIEDPTTAYQADLLSGEMARFTGPFKGATVTISDAKDAVAVCGGVTYTPDADGVIEFAFTEPNSDGQWEFSLYNSAEEDMTFTLTFSGEVGSWLTPAELALGTTAVERQAGEDAYYFTYLAPKTGEMVLTFHGSASWSYTVNDGEEQSGTAAENDTVTIPAENGDLIALQVNTYEPASDTTPAGTVEFHATLITGPVTITNLEQAFMINALAGETVMVNGQFGGENLSIVNAAGVTVTWNGTAYLPNEEGIISMAFDGGDEQLEFSLYNGNEQDTACTLIFGEEKGTKDNPDVLVIGTNIAVCQVGSEGYYFTYVNDTDTDVTVTISFSQTETDWSFKKEGSSSSPKYSTGTTKTFPYKVKTGASLVIIVSTYDPNDKNNVPAGTVEFIVTIK